MSGVLLPSHLLVVGVGGGDDEFLGRGIEDGLLDVVGGVGQAGKLGSQGHYVLEIGRAHV